jgi:hypothetical protein
MKLFHSKSKFDLQTFPGIQVLAMIPNQLAGKLGFEKITSVPENHFFISTAVSLYTKKNKRK